MTGRRAPTRAPASCHSPPGSLEGRLRSGRKVAWLGWSDTLGDMCVIDPLGSPWTASNWLFGVHLLRSGYCGTGVREGGYTGWVPGRVYWVGTTLPTHPVSCIWYCQGPTNARTSVSAPDAGTPGPSWALRTPASPRTQYALLEPI